MLVERHCLTYDDRLTKFFPGFKYGDGITVRHLLNHTSGLQDYEEIFLKREMIDANYPRSSSLDRSHFEPTSSDVMVLLEGEPLRFKPGERWEYSNSGYVVIAQIVERISGLSFSQFVNENIFIPLNMSSSIVCDGLTPPAPEQANSYACGRDDHDIDYTPLNAIYGPSNIYSTLDDLAKWYEAIGTEKLLSTMSTAFTSGKLNDGSDVSYGFGWFLGNQLGLIAASHTGSWVGFRHFVVYYPDHKFVILVLSNCGSRFDDVSRSHLSCRLAKLYLSNYMRIPQGIAVAPEVLTQYAGRYQFQDDECVEINFRNGALWVESGLSSTKLVATSKESFFVADAEADTYEFQQNAGGAVATLVRYMSLFGSSSDAFVKAERLP
jgi:CubicO group peptidase (beta-lactamase class C family)